MEEGSNEVPPVHPSVPGVPPVEPQVELNGSMLTVFVEMMYLVAATVEQTAGKMGSMARRGSPVAIAPQLAPQPERPGPRDWQFTRHKGAVNRTATTIKRFNLHRELM